MLYNLLSTGKILTHIFQQGSYILLARIGNVFGFQNVVDRLRQLIWALIAEIGQEILDFHLVGEVHIQGMGILKYLTVFAKGGLQVLPGELFGREWVQFDRGRLNLDRFLEAHIRLHPGLCGVVPGGIQGCGLLLVAEVTCGEGLGPAEGDREEI